MRKEKTTFNGGSLGSCIDEERSKLRYVMWIAEISESSSLWTQLALLGIPRSMSAWVSLQLSFLFPFFFLFSRKCGKKRKKKKKRLWAETDLVICAALRLLVREQKSTFVFFLQPPDVAVSFVTERIRSILWGKENSNYLFLFYSKLINSGSFSSNLEGKKHQTSTYDLRSGKTTRWT